VYLNKKEEKMSYTRYCTKCGGPISQVSAFCGQCGTSTELPDTKIPTANHVQNAFSGLRLPSDKQPIQKPLVVNETPVVSSVQESVTRVPKAHPRFSRRMLLQSGIRAGIGLVAIGGLYWIGSRIRSSAVTIATPRVKPGTTLITYRGHSGRVYDVAWSPDGKYIVSGAGDHTAQVWEALTGKRITDYTYRSGGSVAWSPNGKYIVSGYGTAQVWEALTGKLIIDYMGHSEFVTSVAWSPDGKYIVSGAYDNTARVWVAP
jgi:WD40 repeat protein